MFAKCGSPILAARGGRVQTKDVQSAAGNYIVIDGKATRLDTFYAHMAEPSLAARRATACAPGR